MANSVEELISELDEPGSSWPDDCPLRKSQYEAFASVRSALNAFSQFGRVRADSGSFIVEMATGTGKTGTIALCATCLEHHKRVLIVVPSDVLRSQLRGELLRTGPSSFWHRIEMLPVATPVIRASAGSDFSIPKKKGSRHISITTAQSLTSYVTNRGKNQREYLQGKFDLVIFDEGHKKAAPKWSESVDSLGVPIVLFTATPYRSDGRPLGAQTIFRHTFVDGLGAARTLKSVVFRELEQPESIEHTVSQLLNAYDAEYGQIPKWKRPKLMVRASSADDVERVVELCRSRRRTVGLHSQFKDKSASTSLTSRRAQISDDAEIIVHQHMLLEGFDDPSVSMVAFLQATDDARVFIQQIGRAVRWDPNAGDSQQAIVYSPSQATAQSTWDSYLAFDRDPGSYVFSGGRFVPTVGKFAQGAEEHLSVPLSVKLRRYDGKRSKKARDDLVEKVAAWLNRQGDLQLLGHSRPKDGELPCEIFILERKRSPSFLKEAFYKDTKLELLLIGFGKETAFVQSTSGRLPQPIRDWTPVDPMTITKLIPDNGALIHSVLLRNLHLSAGAMRSRSLWADDVSHHVHFSRDGSFAPTRLGWHEATAPGTRGVGLAASSYNDSRRGTINEWLNACAEVERLLNAASSRHRLFSNVAQATQVLPSDPYLLQFDIPDGLIIEQGASPITVDDGLVFCELASSSPTQAVGSLQGLGGSPQVPDVEVQYDTTNSTYRLSWVGTVDLSVQMDGQPIDFLRWARDKGRFMVSAENGVTYLGGRLYQQRSPNATNLSNYLVAEPRYAQCTQEVSGDASNFNDPWDSNSVFRVLEDAQLSEFTSLICDDAAGELADFVGFDLTTRRIVLIHAKCSNGGVAGVRIGDLYAVCGQAVKNCFHLHEPPSQGKHISWSSAKHKNRARVRSLALDPLDQIEELYRDHRTRREVWIIQASLDIATLKHELGAKPQPLRTTRMAYLLDHTASAVAAAGASLTIYGQ